MILAVHIGNTHLQVGLFNREELCFSQILSTNHTATPVEFAMAISQLLATCRQQQQLTGGIVSSVVPTITPAMVQAMQLLGIPKPFVVGPGTKSGISIHLDIPSQLGSDRVAESVAAAAHHKGPLGVVHVGTATALSVVDSSGTFVGGMIAPGMLLGLNSLSHSAAQLPITGLTPPRAAIGKNTADSLRSGLFYATAAGIDGMLQAAEEELGASLCALLTGPMAAAISPFCKHPHTLAPQLLLEGLRIIYCKNIKK